MNQTLASPHVYSHAFDIISARLEDRRLLSAEFRRVGELDESITHSVDDSQLPAHLPLNRYWNILPYDYNRVQRDKLRYVNASHICLPDRVRGYVFHYVATQGPLPSTLRDFWSMILLLRVPVVVMLTGIVESGTVKCAQYFPTAVGEVLDLGMGVTVTCSSILPSDATSDMTVRAMGITDTSTKPPTFHTTQHYQFTSWPDHGTPKDGKGIISVCHVLSVNRRQRELQQQQQQQQHQTPVSGTALAESALNVEGPPEAVVHCSAGIGRTGTFLAIDVIRERLHFQAAHGASPRQIFTALDLPNLVHELRQQRMYSVQTLEQYAFIYQVLKDDLQAHLASGPAQQQQQ